jgi:hypothetical protein
MAEEVAGRMSTEGGAARDSAMEGGDGQGARTSLNGKLSELTARVSECRG